ncbi:zinc-binding dehydrogenase [Streptomyces sp. IBSNAI002]|uniref:zinc-binding dehydrogenase n=1 Tax=Streptomyces sp. IBSNAI002 TaxID=3457500 RepID=UPI003FD695DD
MKAFVLHRTGKAAVAHRPVPRPRPGEVLVRTTAALLCAWDGHTAARAPGGGGASGASGASGACGLLGHEAVGVVAAVGNGVADDLVGRRVAAEGHGPLAEYFRLPAVGAGLTALPDTITDHQALYAAGALATGFATAEGAALPAGAAVAVFGQGAVGLSAAVACRRLGAARVIAVEPEIKRQRLALRFGADVVVDPAYEDSAERILELTGGAGVDTAIVATGAAGARTAAYRGIGRGGRVAFARCRPAEGRGGHRLGRMLRLIGDGEVDPVGITTHEFPFDRVEEAHRRLAAAEPGMIKPLVLFPAPVAEPARV